MKYSNRSLSRICAVALTVLGAQAMIGCSAGSDTSDEEVASSNWSREDGSELAADPAGEVTELGEDGLIEKAGCSVVEYCNAPGPEGTRCRQQGCTFIAAMSECEQETAIVCGSAVCPWIFVASNGVRYVKNSCP
jgi:hypothetical protein